MITAAAESNETIIEDDPKITQLATSLECDKSSFAVETELL